MEDVTSYTRVGHIVICSDARVVNLNLRFDKELLLAIRGPDWLSLRV